MQTVQDPKTTLTTRLEQLNARIAEIETELESHQSKDWTELASERESDEVLEEMGLSAQHEIRMIEAALVRVEAGEYGACVTCGAEISPERLALLPATPFCRDCAPRR
ncbi:TraR/DksA family transcriptional regulator [Frigidibacter albus]|uniref:TraR/DksA family transcriptional regulator n=1 Tax=Frigidibacter albus TaxID=1465486 RepID=A0A6L8VMC6_9RHOB|nr:TraR/DksA C4-type zinc finger protein [Frigidibacter albus]MZQ90692.1 TraR/DksA family transcriptional regulator [Frigidibacter albus]NBE32652.1 TraR/DksA family transcriptional regulator [Frigidibacter albus]GGH60220.1 dimethylmenaquinone methyltransferase [Frigidibacter albus]